MDARSEVCRVAAGGAFDDVDACIQAARHRAEVINDGPLGDAEPIWDADTAGLFFASGRYWWATARRIRRRATRARTTTWSEISAVAVDDPTTTRVFPCCFERLFSRKFFVNAPAYGRTLRCSERALAALCYDDYRAFMRSGDTELLRPPRMRARPADAPLPPPRTRQDPRACQAWQRVMQAL